MPNLQSLIRSSYLSVAFGLVATILLPISSVIVSADSCVPATPPTNTGTGVRQPVGADSVAFTYCSSGLWESSHYIYDPATGLTTPKDDPVYTYNPTTGGTDISTWVFSAAKGDYVLRVTTVGQAPAAPTVIATPNAVSPSGGTSINNTGSGSNNTINNTGGVTNGSTIGSTGPNSNNTINGAGTNNLTGINNTTASLNNTLTANANSGNALTLANTSAGDAATGNAQDIANIVNLLQSSSNALDGNTVTFVANIDGDVNGDLLLDPSTFANLQPASGTSPYGTNNLTLTNNLDANINNDITLAAKSGDATLSNNTEAGNASTGSAATVANVVNLINSAVSSGKSFLGVININGNLNGDILLPPDFVDQLVAANVPTVSISTTGPDSTNTIDTNGGSNNTNITNTNNLGITNNVNATAASGAADVSTNTSAGNATTGNAATHITAFNLTGSNVVGRNSILVFVNVLGQWVGLIVNAPAGATAAELGGGITQNSTDANNNTTINNNTNQTINNNINTNATSGNAVLARNTKAGSASSGDANGAVNLLNVQNSSLSLSNWFGVLFINVFGTWHGSFGINTSAGDPIAAAAAGRGGSSGSVGPTTAGDSPYIGSGKFIGFQPHNGTGGGSNFQVSNTPSGTPGSAAASNTSAAVNAVLAASTLNGSKAPSQQLAGPRGNFTRTASIIGFFTVMFILGDAYYSRRHANHKA